MILVEDMMTSYEAHIVSCKQEPFDCFEMDDLIMSHSLVESHLFKALNANLCISLVT